MKLKSVDFIEHPEGGRFREVFRSAHTVSKQDGTRRQFMLAGKPCSLLL